MEVPKQSIPRPKFLDQLTTPLFFINGKEYFGGDVSQAFAVEDTHAKRHTSKRRMSAITMFYLLLTCLHEAKKSKKRAFLNYHQDSRSTKTSALIISSNKPSEPPGFTVGTNLWEAELPALWKLKRANLFGRYTVRKETE